MNAHNFNATRIADWSEIGETEHFVQFYDQDKVLNAAVTGYFEGALRANQSVIFIGTPEHRKVVEENLRREGFDLAALAACDQFFSLDAAATLARFMVNGLPDERLFNVVAGGIMARASKNRRGVRVFGEMVTLLWAQGNKDAAIRLEDLWNDLARTYSFALFCAYPLRTIMSGKNCAPFVHICSQHSRVITTEECGAQ